MSSQPLAPPTDNQLLRVFLRRFGLYEDAEPRELLRDVAAAFARLPYENLTKIIKEAELGTAERARRLPAEVIGDHLSLGTGGTCFSLTAALLHLVRSLGWRAEPILADRPYGADTHCALLVWLDDRPHLLDPGYLLVDPVPLDGAAPQHVETSFNRIRLAPQRGGTNVDLSTVWQGQEVHRLTFKTSPVDAATFLHAWDASFDWDMMSYPLLSRIAAGRQWYLRGNYFQVRSCAALRRSQLPPDEMVEQIAARFGLAPTVVARALAILKRKKAPLA